MVGQLLSLERRVSRSGAESIDHPRHGHDDLINSAAGALVLASYKRPGFVVTPAMLDRFSRPAGRGPSQSYAQQVASNQWRS